MKCIICKNEIIGLGNNPAPIAGKCCCDECNQKIVIPYRLFLARLKYEDTALLITSNEIKLIKPKGKKFTLKELQNAVDGHIEITQNIFPNYLTVVNKE